MTSKFLPFRRKRGTKVTYEVTGTGSFEVTYAVGDPLKGEQKEVKVDVTPWCTISIDGELAVEGAVSARSASATFTALPCATG
ncbi:hypothetical protein [Streptomyces sp. NPDC090112]|uniref:hypothetical protein n=1 Tax=Streptomyces sp. NPDC090112 TaxID=3365949 RepID=UPI0038188BCB